MRELDLREICLILQNRIRVIVLATILCTFAAWSITHYGITPQYTTSIKLYVNNTVEANTAITSSDISASLSLVDTYITILQSDTVLDEVIRKTNVDYSTEELMERMSAGSLNNTEVFQISVTMPDPEQAAEIANAIAQTAPAVLENIVSGSSLKIVDSAKMPTVPSSPDYLKNIMIGFFLGLFVACAVVLVLALLDTRIKTEADLKQISNLPVLGAITQFQTESQGFYGNRYGATWQKREETQ